MWRTYGDVVNFLLRTYAMDVFITEAYNDVVNFRKSSFMTESTYYKLLYWIKLFSAETHIQTDG